MAIGDDATAAGYPLVPNTGDAGQVKLGAQEINRTRDFVAQTKALIPPALQHAFTTGTAAPSGGSDGDIYLKIIG